MEDFSIINNLFSSIINNLFSSISKVNTKPDNVLFNCCLIYCNYFKSLVVQNAMV